MFWRKKKVEALPGFEGSPFEFAQKWLLEKGERISQEGADRFIWSCGHHSVTFQRDDEEGWLTSHYRKTEKSKIDRIACLEQLARLQDQYTDFRFDLEEDELIVSQCQILCGQHDPDDNLWCYISKWKAYLISVNDFPEAREFYVTVRGIEFGYVYEAFDYYMRNVRADHRKSDDQKHLVYNTGTIPLSVAKYMNVDTLGLRYVFGDLYPLYIDRAAQVQEQAVRVRHLFPRVRCTVDESGYTDLSLVAYFSPGTNAEPIFTRLLAEIYGAAEHIVVEAQTGEEMAWARELLGEPTRKRVM